jgi:hypothetical protein
VFGKEQSRAGNQAGNDHHDVDDQHDQLWPAVPAPAARVDVVSGALTHPREASSARGDSLEIARHDFDGLDSAWTMASMVGGGGGGSPDAAQGQNLADELRLGEAVGRRLDRGSVLRLVLAFVPLVVFAVLGYLASR